MESILSGILAHAVESCQCDESVFWSFVFLPFVRGGLGHRRSYWRPPGWVGEMAGESVLPPLLTKEGLEMHLTFAQEPAHEVDGLVKGIANSQ